MPYSNGLESKLKHARTLPDAELHRHIGTFGAGTPEHTVAITELARRGVSRKDKVAWVAVFISLIAALFTGLQWYDAHQTLILSMRPSVDFDTEDDPEEPPIGIAISNAGPAPARIQSISYYVDRKLVGDVAEALQYGKFDPSLVSYFLYEEGDSMAVGEKQWLVKFNKKKAKTAAAQATRFSDWIDQNLAIKVRFCSPIANEDYSGKYCWEKCSTKGRCE